MRNANRGRTAGALKHATPLMKYQYMQRFLELKETISESQPATDTCPRCGGSMSGRPFFMMGKYEHCYSCYEEDQRTKREQAEAQPNHYDDVLNGKVKMTAEYRAQLHAEYNARFTH
jgi:hypothetical protein